MPTEEEIRAWVRDEQGKIDKEKQDACSHAQSGTLNSEKKIVTCDACDYVFELGGEDTQAIHAEMDEMQNRFLEGRSQRRGE